MKIAFKTTSFLLIQIMLLQGACWAGQGWLCLRGERAMLSPAVQMNSSLLQSLFVKPKVFEPFPRMQAFLMERASEGDKHLGKIEMHFMHDQPGILHNILLKIGPNAVMTWLAMFKQEGVNVIRFGIQSDDEQEIDEVIKRLTEIEDTVQEAPRKIKTEVCVLDLELLYQERDLMIIASFFKKEHINVARFLTPVLEEKGSSHFVFELEIPEGEDKRIESKLGAILTKRWGIGGSFKLKKGQLIDRILDGYLLKGLKIAESKKLRKRLRGALKVIVRRRMSMSRKDQKTPFVMHPVEVVRILVNEIGIFTPQIVRRLTNVLKMTEDELIADILIPALLHDAVEDGDISKSNLVKIFKERIADIVLLLSKEQEHKIRVGEAVYFKNMVDRKDINALLAVLIKIADRMHNLRTLKDNKREFQRRIFFSTQDTFIPEFINKIDLTAIKNRTLRKIFKKAIALFEQQRVETGIELGLLDENGEIIEREFEIYQIQEKIRERRLILEVAKKRKILGHGVDETKGGLRNLGEILIRGYIKARQTKLGNISFAGPLRPQRRDEDYLQYIAESSGDYGPFYIILDPRLDSDFSRVEVETKEKKIILPGCYKAKELDKNKWGIPHSYHQAYLVPTEQDRKYLINSLEKAVKRLVINQEYASQAKNKIITYFEFLKEKENNSQNNRQLLNKNKIKQKPTVSQSLLPSSTALIERAI